MPIYSLDNKGGNRSGGYLCILLSLGLLEEPSRVSLERVGAVWRPDAVSARTLDFDISADIAGCF